MKPNPPGLDLQLKYNIDVWQYRITALEKDGQMTMNMVAKGSEAVIYLKGSD